MIRLIFDDIKPISKQKGYEFGYRWIKSKRCMTKYKSKEYAAFKQAIGLLAQAECRKQRWNGPKTSEVAVCGYFYCPRGIRSQDLADNAFSGFLDAFEGIIYDNDRKIVRAYYERIFTRKMLRVEFVFIQL